MALTLTPATLTQHIGQEIGVSPWVEITQDNVNRFADITLDPQFIHVDQERAAQTPFGGTIAHGFLTLSMLSYFAESGAGVGMEGMTMGINYGFDQVRFSPVRLMFRKLVRGHLLIEEDNCSLPLATAAAKHFGQFVESLKFRASEINDKDKDAHLVNVN